MMIAEPFSPYLGYIQSLLASKRAPRLLHQLWKFGQMFGDSWEC
jgi:hypothetical protein